MLPLHLDLEYPLQLTSPPPRHPQHLARKYRSRALPEEELKQCLYSIGDNNAYLYQVRACYLPSLRFICLLHLLPSASHCLLLAFHPLLIAYLYQARDPVDKMISYLRDLFPAENPTDAQSLAITGGESGARLTHSHQRQHAFVMQASCQPASLQLPSSYRFASSAHFIHSHSSLLSPLNSHLFPPPCWSCSRSRSAIHSPLHLILPLLLTSCHLFPPQCSSCSRSRCGAR